MTREKRSKIANFLKGLMMSILGALFAWMAMNFTDTAWQLVGHVAGDILLHAIPVLLGDGPMP